MTDREIEESLALRERRTRAAFARAVMHAYFGTAGAISYDDQTTPVKPAIAPEILK